MQLGNDRDVLPFSVLIGDDGQVLKRRFGSFESASDLQQWAAQAQLAHP